MNAVLLMFTLCLNPPPLDPVVDIVDRIEINHCYYVDGRPFMDQVIFWRWYAKKDKYHIVTRRTIISMPPRPTRDVDTGLYLYIWSDKSCVRKVYAKVFRETYTGFNPDMRDQNDLPRYLRAGLSKSQEAMNIFHRHLVDPFLK